MELARAPRRLASLLACVLAAAGSAGPARAETAAAADEAETPEARARREAAAKRSQDDDPQNVDTPLFPEVRYRDAFRLRLSSFFAPGSDFGSAEASLYQPELRLRVTVPLSKRAVLQLTARGRTSQYDFDGTTDLFGLGPTGGDPLDSLWATSLFVQGAYRLNDDRYLFLPGESWSLLAGGVVRSRWEDGAFEDGLTGGGAFALGYQSARVRIAVGLSVESSFDGGVDVGPVATIRLDPTDHLTILNRGQGLQIEYRLFKHFRVFAASYLDGDRYRLHDRPGVSGNPKLRDQRVLAGVGFEWKIASFLRLNLEGGAVAWRRLRVRASGSTLSSMTAEASGYCSIQIGLRPPRS